MGTVVITGANRGIGLGLAKHYIDAGDRVVALCRDPDGADQLARLSAGSGGRLTVGSIDTADDASVAAAAAAFVEPVDILINNAGIIGGRDQSLAGIDTQEWLAAFDVIAIGPFRVSRAFHAQLRAARGKIGIITSHLGSSTWPLGGHYAYATSKAACNRITRALAVDLRDDGVAVACIHPGHVQTDMAAPGAQLTPADSAAGIAAVMAMLSPATSGGFFRWDGEVHPW